MNNANAALFFAALLVIGACADPRKLLASTEGAELAAADEHQRILVELEEVHQLRERMLRQGKSTDSSVHSSFDHECLVVQTRSSKQNASIQHTLFLQVAQLLHLLLHPRKLLHLSLQPCNLKKEWLMEDASCGIEAIVQDLACIALQIRMFQQRLKLVLIF